MKGPRAKKMTPARIESGGFPSLPIPLPIPFPPMEATRAGQLPPGDDWQFEPKWDGFRALVFRSGEQIVLQSKSGQPLARYFPELIKEFAKLKQKSFVLDGEIVISVDGRLSFDDLLMRIHPAASRIAKLSAETPAMYFAFDLLYQSTGKKKLLVKTPLYERRQCLEIFFRKAAASSSIKLTPATRERKTASQWFRKWGAMGLDGVIAKKVNEPYHSGDRKGMVKVKNLKTADCVVGGFRYATGSRMIGSLLLGLYDSEGKLNHVGFTSSFTPQERKQLKKILEPMRGGKGFSGRAPGGPSRWSTERSGEWEPVNPFLVCEVRYDYFSQQRFRHGTKFLRWRPDKKPKMCTLDQVATTGLSVVSGPLSVASLLLGTSKV
jgi:ATP-dependent DNA ligase